MVAAGGVRGELGQHAAHGDFVGGVVADRVALVVRKLCGVLAEVAEGELAKRTQLGAALHVVEA